MRLFNRLKINTKLVLTLVASTLVALLVLGLAEGSTLLILLRKTEPGDYNPFVATGQLMKHSGLVAGVVERGGGAAELRQAAIPDGLPPHVRVQVVRHDGLILVDTHGQEGQIISGPEMVGTFSRMGNKGGKLVTLPQPVIVKDEGWGLYIMTFNSPISSNIKLGDGSFESNLVIWTLVGGLLAAMLASVLQFIFLGRHLVVPIRRLSAVVGQITRGDLTARSGLSNRTDELGQLARDVDTMAASLQEAREQAAAADKSRRYLVAAASHDLRTPLTAILANVEAVRTGVTEHADQALAVVQEKGLQLKRLIEDLFELSSLDAAQEKWQTLRVDLGELVRREVVGVLPELESAGFAVEADIPEEPLWADLAPGKIERVLGNLLDNARHYGAPGRWVGIRVSRQGAAIRVEVCDRGPGISPEEREKVFDRFYRADSARTSNNGAGRGLGLAIAREVVLRHGGRIGVESPPGGGACFWFELPAGN